MMFYLRDKYKSTRVVDNNQWLTTTTRPEPTARTWRIRIFTGKMHDEKRKKRESSNTGDSRKAGITWSPPNLGIFKKCLSGGLEMQSEGMLGVKRWMMWVGREDCLLLVLPGLLGQARERYSSSTLVS